MYVIKNAMRTLESSLRRAYYIISIFSIVALRMHSTSTMPPEKPITTRISQLKVHSFVRGLKMKRIFLRIGKSHLSVTTISSRIAWTISHSPTLPQELPLPPPTWVRSSKWQKPIKTTTVSCGVSPLKALRDASTSSINIRRMPSTSMVVAGVTALPFSVTHLMFAMPRAPIVNGSWANRLKSLEPMASAPFPTSTMPWHTTLLRRHFISVLKTSPSFSSQLAFMPWMVCCSSASLPQRNVLFRISLQAPTSFLGQKADAHAPSSSWRAESEPLARRSQSGIYRIYKDSWNPEPLARRSQTWNLKSIKTHLNQTK